jgi:glycosyltransferase involved in cell wall biosynthesis
MIEELSKPPTNPNCTVYAASLAGEPRCSDQLGWLDTTVCQWLGFSQRPNDPLRWWRLGRWLQREQPDVIRFWVAPSSWLRRLVRFASPRSRWQVLFRERGELPTTKAWQGSWSSMEVAWFDNPLLENLASETLRATLENITFPRDLLALPQLLETSGFARAGCQEMNPRALKDASSSPRAELREKLFSHLGLPPKSILLVTVGPLVREKNMDQLFWSLDQLSCTRDDVRLLVIGDGPDRARLEHHARLNHVAHRIIWLGHVDSPEEYLRAADLYVSADPRERVSRALLEARAVGLPIIAHDTATNRQIVTLPEHGKLVDPTYVADYAGTMYRWLLVKG